MGAQPAQPPQARGGWSLSSEGAQLLLALISCGDFLTVLETPGRLRLWERCWFRKDGLPLPPTETHPPKPSGDPAGRMPHLCRGEGWEDRGGMYQQLRVPLTAQP